MEPFEHCVIIFVKFGQNSIRVFRGYVQVKCWRTTHDDEQRPVTLVKVKVKYVAFCLLFILNVRYLLVLCVSYCDI